MCVGRRGQITHRYIAVQKWIAVNPKKGGKRITKNEAKLIKAVRQADERAWLDALTLLELHRVVK